MLQNPNKPVSPRPTSAYNAQRRERRADYRLFSNTPLMGEIPWKKHAVRFLGATF
jgi:hypothetical protein